MVKVFVFCFRTRPSGAGKTRNRFTHLVRAVWREQRTDLFPIVFNDQFSKSEDKTNDKNKNTTRVSCNESVQRS